MREFIISHIGYGGGGDKSVGESNKKDPQFVSATVDFIVFKLEEVNQLLGMILISHTSIWVLFVFINFKEPSLVPFGHSL